MTQTPAWMSRSFLLALFLLVLYSFFRLLEPFLSGLLAAAVLAIVVEPAHQRLARALGARGNLCAALSTVGTALLIIGPGVLLLWMVLGEAEALLPRLGELADRARTLHGGGEWPLLRSLNEFTATLDGGELVMDVEMLYFNSSTAKALMNIFRLLETAAQEGVKVTINWWYHEDDDTMRESGEDFAEDFEKAGFNLRRLAD